MTLCIERPPSLEGVETGVRGVRPYLRGEIRSEGLHIVIHILRNVFQKMNPGKT
jgi:hypothetical protein